MNTPMLREDNKTGNVMKPVQTEHLETADVC